MARGTISNDERCFNGQELEKTEKTNGLRVRFLDEEGKTERTVSADEVDSISRVKKIHILKNRSSSETSILLRNSSLIKRRNDRRNSDGTDNLNNNSLKENLNSEKTEDCTKESHFRRNTNVYSVNQAKTLSAERKRIPLALPRLINHRDHVKSILPAEVALSDVGIGKEITTWTIGKLSRGLGRLLRRTNSVRISEPDPMYKVAYLGNVLTGWARGEGCIEKPLATLWRNYQQSTKPDVVMKLSVTNSGLKGITKEHGLTEYWSHRITYCTSPPHYPKLFCWVYRHEGKKLKHELRCHAVLCTKESISKKITEELQCKLKQALVEFKKDRISKQNARLSLANSVYDNPSMPRRKILLSVGALNYRPPLERSKSAPKLGAIEELCSEEEEEAECSNHETQTLDRRRPDVKSPRKMSCPENVRAESESKTEDILNLLVQESKLKNEQNDKSDAKANYLVTDSDDGSVSSGCETASTVTSDTEPTSLPQKDDSDKFHRQNDRQNYDSFTNDVSDLKDASDEVNHVPIGENNFRRRSTYPPLNDVKFESLLDNLTDVDSLHSSTETDVFKADNESACSDESGYSELLEKDSIIGNTIMV